MWKCHFPSDLLVCEFIFEFKAHAWPHRVTVMSHAITNLPSVLNIEQGVQERIKAYNGRTINGLSTRQKSFVKEWDMSVNLKLILSSFIQ